MFSSDGCVVFSVINRDYIELAEEWARRVFNVTGKKASFACADRESHDRLAARGFQCFDFCADTREKQYSNRYFNPHAAYTVSLKFKLALHFIRSGMDCVYSDVDAFWVKNPLPSLETPFSLAFQPGSFPKEAKGKWGFAACTGFAAFSHDEIVADFLIKAIPRFNGSDQLAFNQTLLQDYSISWESRPQDWEHCGIQNGWTVPIAGRCSTTGLSLLALPHYFFQRHNTTREDCAHAMICHPNSPKDQLKKISLFRSLGLWPAKGK